MCLKENEKDGKMLEGLSKEARFKEPDSERENVWAFRVTFQRSKSHL